MRVGTKRWASYKPGRYRRYQLQLVITSGGGIRPLSEWMQKKEATAWARGYNKRAGKRGRIPYP